MNAVCGLAPDAAVNKGGGDMLAGCLVLLLYPTVSDIRIRKFYIEPIAAIAVIFAGIGLISRQVAIVDIMLGCLPGIAALGISRITKESIGAGDAVVITGLGSIVGWESVCHICLLGLVLCGITGLVLIVFGKADRKTTLPFIPFLTIAVLALWIING